MSADALPGGACRVEERSLLSRSSAVLHSTGSSPVVELEAGELQGDPLLVLLLRTQQQQHQEVEEEQEELALSLTIPVSHVLLQHHPDVALRQQVSDGMSWGGFVCCCSHLLPVKSDGWWWWW
jgi:hypothetical protein